MTAAADEGTGGSPASSRSADDTRSAALAAFLQRSVEPDPDARPAWSRLAFASAIAGLIGPLWPVGLVAGVVALVRVRRSKRGGQAFAVAGIALSALWAAMFLVVDTGTSGDDRVRTVSGYDLRAGDCFGLQSADAFLAHEVTAVPCARTHHGEAVGFADLGVLIAGSPADRERQARTDCAALVRDHVAAGRDLPATAAVDVLLPQGNSVVVRTRTRVVCAVVDPGPGWTGSLRDPVPADAAGA
ncbi:DUF4190 domain-containing protein [Kitasatospora sp. NPDC085879]|uniref:DUF4190 domain-containing protein n=1 Tax=Kitasatospora sp. NPDC085879 TaxID=3154769 RepID=UPI00342D671C